MKSLPIILAVIGITLVIFFVSFQSGGNLSSSLLEEQGFTPLSTVELPTASSTGTIVQEFDVLEDRTASLRGNIQAIKDSGTDLGFYIPTIYRVPSARVSAGGGSVSIGLHTTTQFPLERGLRFTLQYPDEVMSYAGPTTLTNPTGQFVFEGQQRPGEVDVQFVPNADLNLFTFDEVTPFVSLPFQFTNPGKIDLRRPLLLSIVRAERDLNNLTSEPFPFFARPVDALYFESRLQEGEDINRDVVTDTVIPDADDRQEQLDIDREVPTIEVPQVEPEQPAVVTPPVVTPPVTTPPVVTPPVTTPSTTGTIGTSGTGVVTPVVPNNRPVVTTDETRLSPHKVKAQSESIIFIYLSVQDLDGKQDIQSVSVDLTSFGLPADRALIEVSANASYTLYSASFVLPNTVPASDLPISIPYRVLDRSGAEVKGALSLTVEPAVVAPVVTQPTTPVVTQPTTPVVTQPTTPVVTQPTTPVVTQPVTQPSGVINVDINKDGVVNTLDLDLFRTNYRAGKATIFVKTADGTGAYPISIDINGDGVLDDSDFDLFLDVYTVVTTS